MASGGRVGLSRGTFSIAAPVYLGSYQQLCGMNKVATSLKLADSANCDVISTLTTDVARYSIAIRDLGIDGNKANNTSGNGISLYRAWYTPLENLEVKDMSGKGIYYALPGSTLAQNACLFDIGVKDCEGTGIDFASGAITDSLIMNARTYNCGTVDGYNISIDSSGRTHLININASYGSGSASAAGSNVYIGPSSDGCYAYGLMVEDYTAAANGLEIYATTAYNTGSQIFGGLIVNNGSGTHTGSGIYVHGTVSTSKKVEALLVQGVRIEKYAYSVKVGDAKCEDTKLLNNSFVNYVTGPVSDSGTRTIIRGNTGYVDENDGTSKIDSGATTVNVTLGLSSTPTVINVTFAEAGSNDYGRWWISSAGATTFTVNVTGDPGASNLDFWWEAKVR